MSSKGSARGAIGRAWVFQTRGSVLDSPADGGGVREGF